MAHFQVVEIFESINGEGMYAGELSVFVRLKNCNLHCSYCDTRWACEDNCEFKEMSEEEILNQIRSFGVRRVTLTGGEPLLHPEIHILLERLCKEEDLEIEIETNGSISIYGPETWRSKVHFTMDYKMPGSGMESFMDTKNLLELNSKDTLKMVVSHEEDLIRAKDIIDKYQLIDKCNIILSPVFGKIETSDIVQFMIDNKLNGVRLQLQLHKYIWDPMKRGV